MGKGHYHGGGTLLGFGTTGAKSKGRSGGLDLSSPVERQRAIEEAKKRQKKIAERTAAAEAAVKRLSDQWRAEKGRKHFEQLQQAERARTSPPAAGPIEAMATRAADPGKR